MREKFSTYSGLHHLSFNITIFEKPGNNYLLTTIVIFRKKSRIK